MVFTILAFLAFELFSTSSFTAGIAVLVVGGVATAWANIRRKDRDTKQQALVEKEKEEADIRATQTEQGKLLSEMHRAMVGSPPSPLDPFPPPGMVAIVPELQKDVKKISHTLFVNGGAGNTMLDRVDRMETALQGIATLGKQNQAIATRVEKQQTQNESERKVRHDDE